MDMDRLTRALSSPRKHHMCAHLRRAIELAHEPLESESHEAHTTRKSMEEQDCASSLRRIKRQQVR